MMITIEEITKWIVENKEIVIMAAEAIAALVFFIVKKKPNKVVNTYIYDAIKYLTCAINAAEKIIGSGHGEEKKTYAIQYVKEQMTKQYPEIKFDEYKKYIEKWLENILETPQKKGDSK